MSGDWPIPYDRLPTWLDEEDELLQSAAAAEFASPVAVRLWQRDIGLADAEAPAIRDRREPVLTGSIARVENSAVSFFRPPPSGFSAEYQIVLPYLGMFEYRVGRSAHLVDVNRTLYVVAGQEYEDRHPVRGLGHAAVIITPERSVLDELCGPKGLERSDAFTSMTRPAGAGLALWTHRLLAMRAQNDNCLAGEEVALAALRQALAPARSRPASSRLVSRAKEYLHAHGCGPVSLDEVAAAVGASPVYLTQEFTRSEGIPLYRYQTQVRLSRALVELPHCDSITGLALDLGFSSHSHFTAAFKGVFGLTPSEYRRLR